MCLGNHSFRIVRPIFKNSCGLTCPNVFVWLNLLEGGLALNSPLKFKCCLDFEGKLERVWGWALIVCPIFSKHFPSLIFSPSLSPNRNLSEIIFCKMTLTFFDIPGIMKAFLHSDCSWNRIVINLAASSNHSIRFIYIFFFCWLHIVRTAPIIVNADPANNCVSLRWACLLLAESPSDAYLRI